MTERKYLELPPDEALEHQLLMRRIERLTMKNSWAYRFGGKRKQQLNAIYADVADSNAFCEKLASIQTQAAANMVSEIG